MLKQFYKNGIKKSRAKTAPIIMVYMLLIAVAPVFGQNNHESHAPDSSVFTPEIWGLEFGVSDIDRAIDFYTGVLGFKLENNSCCAPATVLRNGDVRLLLRHSSAPVPVDGSARVSLNMLVDNLITAVNKARTHGARIDDPTPRSFPFGRYIPIGDPFGNSIELVDVEGDQMTDESTPTVFNFGVVLENLESAEAFYSNIGFQVFSRNYLPAALPLKLLGAAQLILHGGAQSPAQPGTRNPLIILATSNLKSAVGTLQNHGLTIEQKAATDSTVGFAILRDPSDNQLKLTEFASVSSEYTGTSNSSSMQMSTPELARAAFERFKKLEGQWLGRSTKGWEEVVSYKTIAQGSVVVANSFDAHPNETMMTMFHLDGDRLMLTHYCVAGNQPRLEATSFADDGRTITFAFLDATNLPSRDHGHMDKHVFRFLNEDHLTSVWTWYQDGKESWMEKIHLERKE